jgi:hypothetical protein
MCSQPKKLKPNVNVTDQDNILQEKEEYNYIFTLYFLSYILV